MKREAMNGLRSLAKMGRWSGWMPVEMAQDILDELKRLRRVERAARKAVSMQTAEGLGAALGELADALKKGGRK